MTWIIYLIAMAATVALIFAIVWLDLPTTKRSRMTVYDAIASIDSLIQAEERERDLARKGPSETPSHERDPWA